MAMVSAQKIMKGSKCLGEVSDDFFIPVDSIKFQLVKR